MSQLDIGRTTLYSKTFILNHDRVVKLVLNLINWDEILADELSRNFAETIITVPDGKGSLVLGS